MLEFIQKEKDYELYVEAQDTKGDKGVFFTLITPNKEQISYDFLDAEKMLYLATYLNVKLGFDFCNIENIKGIIKQEEEQSST